MQGNISQGLDSAPIAQLDSNVRRHNLDRFLVYQESTKIQ